jgi:hypothetical protein
MKLFRRRAAATNATRTAPSDAITGVRPVGMRTVTGLAVNAGRSSAMSSLWLTLSADNDL